MVNTINSSTNIKAFSHIECIDVFRERQFDLITAWMVLEHLPNPTEILLDFHRWLSDDGVLAISVPDASCIFRKIFGRWSYDIQVPSHISHFSPRTLRSLLSRCGFSIVKQRFQPDSKTLLLSIAQFLDTIVPGSTAATKQFLSTRSGLLVNICLGTILALLRISSRIEVTAIKK